MQNKIIILFAIGIALCVASLLMKRGRVEATSSTVENLCKYLGRAFVLVGILSGIFGSCSSCLVPSSNEPKQKKELSEFSKRQTTGCAGLQKPTESKDTLKDFKN